MAERPQQMVTLADHLADRAVEGSVYERLGDDRVRCHACAHRCLIPEGREGICRVRFNRAGRLYVPSGYAASVQCDPIEKKPFFHAWPGSLAFSFGMLGCDYHCSFCQNWITSQALRDVEAGAPVRDISAAGLVSSAVGLGARVVTSTYNEPLITVEWAVEVFRLAREQGLATAFVSNGNATPEVLDFLEPHIDLYKVDLKAFRKEAYRDMGGRLEPVLETIGSLWQRGIWVEVVTLVIPGLNDSDGELADIAAFLAGVSVDIPWHVTAFRPDYRMHGPARTPPATLLRAVEHGREAGLRHVYAGNLPGSVGEAEHTRCPACGEVVVERFGFRVLGSNLDGSRCAACGSPVAGRWGS